MVPSTLKQYPRFFTSQWAYFRLGMIGSAVVASETEGRVRRQQSIFHSQGEKIAYGTTDILQALGTEPFLPADVDEQATIRPAQGREQLGTQHGKHMTPQVHCINACGTEITHLTTCVA